MKDSEIEILICSCDAYSDVWHPFFTLFFRYWPDCPYKINIIANQKSVADSRVTTIATCAEDDWSSAFQHALSEIGSKYIIVLMEDYLLTRPVDTKAIRELGVYVEANNIVCLYLYPLKGTRRACSDLCGHEIGEVSPDARFRVNLQAALWDRGMLQCLVQKGENAWTFEVQGTRRSKQMGGRFLSLIGSPDESPLVYYCTGVVRGKWMPGAVRLCREEGVTLDYQERKIGWVRGLFRDCRLLQPIRHVFVFCKRICGVH